MTTRTERLLREMRWSQKLMGAYLGVDQSCVSALVRGRAETRPISRLLEMLERANQAGRVKKGASPVEALDAILEAIGLAP